MWTRDGEMPFLCQGADGSKIIFDGDAAPSLSTSIVKTVDLNRFLSEEVDLIKIDIEGAEYEVVPHITNRLLRVKNMLIECHINNGQVGPFSKLLSALCSAAFKISVNTYGARRDLVRRPAKLPAEFDQYALIAAWRS